MDQESDPRLLPLNAYAPEANVAEPVQCASRPSAVMLPGKGTFFDEHIDLRDPEGAAFTARVIEVYDTVRPRKRKRGREALTMRVRKLLANGMRTNFYRKAPSVLYFKGAESKHYRNSPGWMRHGALGDVVDALRDAGLAATITGVLERDGTGWRSWASSYTPSNKLIDLATECGISAKSLDHRLQHTELVRLFGPKPDREFDWDTGKMSPSQKGKPISFQPTAETDEWISTLEAINTFYRQQEIGLELSADALALDLAAQNDGPEQAGAPLRIPELFKMDIYRVFNNGEVANPKFDKGGRLFGGWWMSVSEEMRRAITINGQPTVEIDYAECHPRMLYHRAGLEPDGQVYILPEIAAYEASTGSEPGTYRPYVKWLMQVLINCRGRPGSVDLPEKILVPPDLTVKQVVGFIKARHQPIVGDFETGAGLDLMRIESDIALEIVSKAMAEGWTALSVHDSFITTVDRQDRLEAMMSDAYVRRLGRKPSFK